MRIDAELSFNDGKTGPMNVETTKDGETVARKRAMGLLARASTAELSEALDRSWPEHRARDLKPAETGLVMLRGRAGGDELRRDDGAAQYSHIQSDSLLPP